MLVKGILHPDDALQALDSGMDEIIVSNHGGRQVDGSIAALDALPAVAAAVAGRAPILMDGESDAGPMFSKPLLSALGRSSPDGRVVGLSPREANRAFVTSCWIYSRNSILRLD
jgi:FMN-dependent dehydrogenase